jgi:hypothetical protein
MLYYHRKIIRKDDPWVWLHNTLPPWEFIQEKPLPATQRKRKTKREERRWPLRLWKLKISYLGDRMLSGSSIPPRYSLSSRTSINGGGWCFQARYRKSINQLMPKGVLNRLLAIHAYLFP